MSAELYAVIAISTIVITALLTVIYLNHREYDRVLTLVIMKAGEKEINWNFERQQLLDRIQAPSFDHLKQAEIRVIKATNNTPEPPKLEQL